MKQAVNFRLNEASISALTMLEDKLECSKTKIVEKALQAYAKKILHDQKKLLKFAGVLTKHDADKMLADIYENRKDKDIEFDL